MFIEVDGLKKYFPLRDGSLASRPASFARWTASAFKYPSGHHLGPVGGSGGGKTTVGRTLLGLYEKERRQREISRSGAGRLTGPALRAIRPDAAGISGSLQLAEPRLRIGE